MTVLGVLVIGVIVNVMNVIQGLWTVIKIAFEAMGAGQYVCSSPNHSRDSSLL